MKESNRIMFRIAGFVAIIGCISMMLFPTIALESAQKGVNLWAGVVLPALLPFFICANFMIAVGIPNLIGKFFEKPFQFFFGAPGCSAFIFIISITSGYPMGPKLIGDMRRRGEIALSEAKRMLTFCSTSGPLFMLGTVGVGMLHSPSAGAIITISHYLGAIFNGIIFHLLSKKEKQIYLNNNLRLKNKLIYEENSILELFTDAIISSLKTLGIICGYIIIFTMITDFLELTKAFASFQKYQIGIFKGLLEMTVGCNDLALSEEISIQLKCVLATFLISFGGFSVLAQSMSVLYKSNISLWYYFKAKMMHGLIAGAIAYFLTPYLMSFSVNPVSNFGIQTWNFNPGMVAQLLFSTKMIIIIMFMFAITIIVDYLIGRKETIQK